MGDKSWLEKILYKHQYLGVVEKDGRVYKKFKKIRRFVFLDKLGRVLMYIVLLLVVLGILQIVSTVTVGKR
jgi:small-conductance mechanosensitive channel